MKSIFLFGIRDLRIENNFALFQAIKSSKKIIPVFIFDESLFNTNKFNEYQKSFIYYSVKLLQNQIKNHNSKLVIRYGKLLTELLNILNEAKINNIYFNNNYNYSEIKFLSEEYNYKVFSYSDIEPISKIKRQKFLKYKQNFNFNYKFNISNYKILKFDENIKIFSDDIDSSKYLRFKNNKFDNLHLQEISNIDINNYEDIILFLEFGLISPLKIKNIIEEKNYFSQLVLDYLYFNEYKKLFSNYEFDFNYSENISLFTSLINSNTNNNLINAISKAILEKRVLSAYHLNILISFAIKNNINILWIKNFLKNELINFDEDIFNAIQYNIISNIENELYNSNNIFYIKKYLPKYNIPDFFYIYPYQIPVSLQKNRDFIIGKNFPECKTIDKKLYF